MILTNRLKKWLIENAGVKANADDEAFRKAAGEAIAEGDLDVDVMVKLTSTKEDKEASELSDLLSGIKDSISDLKTVLSSDDEDEEEETPRKKSKKPAPVMDDEDEEEDEEEEEMPEKKAVKKTPAQKSQPSALEKMVGRLSVPLDDDDEEKSFDLRIKAVSESYNNQTKTALIYPTATEKGKPHPLAGRPVMDYSEPGKGRALDTLTDLDKAVAGSYAKFMVASAVRKSRTLAYMALPDHDKQLLHHAMEKMAWGGSSDGGNEADIKGRKLSPREQKALIDDATSGGLEAAPIVFDDQVIQTPLLHGELFPLVNTVPLDRGRRVEGVATGTVTGSWGGVDDTEVSLFNTASYVSAFDTTIFRWEGAVRVGLDFLSDTPIDFGAHLTTQYGERLLEDLDDVIATGNGTTQPEGISVKSGTTSVSFGGSTSIGSYESLRFGVTKPEHRANLMASAVFCGTETSYQRARAIPVGASDARRLGGSQATVGGVSDYGSYNWMGLPYKINESLGNTKIFYAILGRYRMYRRRGLTIRTSSEGDTLIRRNEMLMVAMARYGGQLERGACAAVTSTAPA